MRRSSSFFILLLIGLTGCSPAEPATINGTVKFKGQLLEAGTLGIHPAGGGTPYYTSISENGIYMVPTTQGASIRTGDYIVTVVGTDAPKQHNGPPGPGKQITPERYSKKETTDLRITVNPGSNTIHLELQPE